MLGCDGATGSALFLMVVSLLFNGRQTGFHAPLKIVQEPVEELMKDLSEIEALLDVTQVEPRAIAFPHLAAHVVLR
jgi:hypothetical protein